MRYILLLLFTVVYSSIVNAQSSPLNPYMGSIIKAIQHPPNYGDKYPYYKPMNNLESIFSDISNTKDLSSSIDKLTQVLENINTNHPSFRDFPKKLYKNFDLLLSNDKKSISIVNDYGTYDFLKFSNDTLIVRNDYLGCENWIDGDTNVSIQFIAKYFKGKKIYFCFEIPTLLSPDLTKNFIDVDVVVNKYGDGSTSRSSEVLDYSKTMFVEQFYRGDLDSNSISNSLKQIFGTKYYDSSGEISRTKFDLSSQKWVYNKIYDYDQYHRLRLREEGLSTGASTTSAVTGQTQNIRYGWWKYYDSNRKLKYKIKVNYDDLDERYIPKNLFNQRSVPSPEGTVNLIAFHANGNIKFEGQKWYSMDKQIFIGPWNYYNFQGDLISKIYYSDFKNQSNFSFKKDGNRYYKKNQLFNIVYKPQVTADLTFNGTNCANSEVDVNEYFHNKEIIYPIEGIYSGTIAYTSLSTGTNKYSNVEALVLEIDNMYLMELADCNGDKNDTRVITELINSLILKQTTNNKFVVSRDYGNDNLLPVMNRIIKKGHHYKAIDINISKNHSLHANRSILNNVLNYSKDEIYFETIFDDYKYIVSLNKTYQPKRKIVNKTSGAIKLPIIKRGDMNFITINLGGKDFEFLLDTGASDILINSEIERHLVNIGVLRGDDYLEPVKYQIADGSTKLLNIASLNTMKIGDTYFYDNTIAIGDANASLLLGMSFLNKFDWEINGSTLVLIEK